MQKIIKVADKVLNCIISLFIILALLYSFWGIYDVVSIYSQADSHFTFGLNKGDTSLTEYQVINDDVCAIIKIPNTGIDYPVVQGKTNTEYINKSYDLKDCISGSIFIDCNNSKYFTDFYTLFYGHRMDASAMFGDIARFTEAAYFNNHPVGILSLPTGEHDIEFFACCRVLANNKNFFDVGYANKNIGKVMKEIENTAVQSRSVVVDGGDRIIALSTCEDATTSGRIILFGVVKGE